MASLLAKAFAVYMKLMPPDDLASTKSMNSASDVWRRLLEAAVREALAKAVQKSIDEPQMKSRGPEKSVYVYKGNFAPSQGGLLSKTHQGNVPLNAAAVFDAFAEICCTTRKHFDDTFCMLYEPQSSWRDSCLVCPMCREEYDVFTAKLDSRGYSCQLCGFTMPLHHQSLDLCQVTVMKEKRAANGRLEGGEPDPRLQRLFFSLLVVKHLMEDNVGWRSLKQALTGKCERKVGGIIGGGIENSAKGINTKRGVKAAVELHDNLIDGRCSKDSNPDLRVYLLTGSLVQWTPSSTDLAALRERLVEVKTSWDQAGRGRLELRGGTFARFNEHAVARVMMEVRTAVHAAAESLSNDKLATCCPVLHHRPSGPVVTLLCSGNELVRAVGWRVFTAAERSAMKAMAAGGAVDPTGLPRSWARLAHTGLTWDMLVFAGIVTYCALDRHLVLKDSVGEDFVSDGLTFYKISVEMESSMRALQTEDAATHPMGHTIRAGYSIGLAAAAHRPASLSSGRGTTSDRSAGLGPDPANIRSLIGDAPGNHYGSSMKLIALLHDFGSRMQEDSMPLDVDAMRHDVFQHVTETFLAASHYSDLKSEYSHLVGVNAYLTDHPQNCHPKVAEWLDDRTGLVKKAFAYVERGQAVCFIPNGKLQEKTQKGKSKGAAPMEPILHLAKSDMWIASIEVPNKLGRWS